jgi:hypothetical protein
MIRDLFVFALGVSEVMLGSSGCKRADLCQTIRYEHCTEILELRLQQRRNLEAIADSVARIEVPEANANQVDKAVYFAQCAEREDAVKEAGSYVDGFLNASQAIEIACPYEDLKASGRDEPFTDILSTTSLNVYDIGCLDRKDPKTSADQLKKEAAQLAADIDGALEKCRVSGWSPPAWLRGSPAGVAK